MASLNITLTKSPIGYSETQKRTVAALGLRKMHKTVTRPDNAAVRGMIDTVRHLVTVIPVEDPSAASK
jgi:large subunit ribosomal protein L30